MSPVRTAIVTSVAAIGVAATGAVVSNAQELVDVTGPPSPEVVDHGVELRAKIGSFRWPQPDGEVATVHRRVPRTLRTLAVHPGSRVAMNTHETATRVTLTQLVVKQRRGGRFPVPGPRYATVTPVEPHEGGSQFWIFDAPPRPRSATDLLLTVRYANGGRASFGFRINPHRHASRR